MKRSLDALTPHLEGATKIVLLLFLSSAALIFLVHVSRAVLYPYPLDYGEAPLLDQAMRLAAGQNIYRADLSSPPYTISNYPPLYPLLMAPFVGLFGPFFLTGRLISILCALASAVFLAKIIYHPTRDRVAAATAGLLFLAFPYVAGWSPLARVDLLALAFSSAGLYVLVRWPATRRGLLLSGFLLVGAIYTRQSYALAAPLAAFTWLWTQDRRHALGLAGLVGGISLALLLLLTVATRGGFFFHVATANLNEFEIESLGRSLNELLRTAPVLLILAGVFLVLAARRIKSWPLLAPYLIGAFLSALTIGKIGSGANYFLEMVAALSLISGASIAWSRQHAWLRIALLVLLALQTGLLIQATLRGPVEWVNWCVSRPAKDFEDLERIIRNADAPVLADEFMGMLTVQKKPLYIQPFEVTQLARAGLWDQTPLLESIRRREFSAVLIHHFMSYPEYRDRWTPEMLSAIMDNYAPTDFLAETIVYRPRDLASNEAGSLRACPHAPWRLPTSSELGMWWAGGQPVFMGQGYENTVPVRAVADGLLRRDPGWHDAVAIQHDDPLQPGEKVWTFYLGMASGWQDESFVSRDFPEGSQGVPVERGRLLGYQGQWSGQPGSPIWVHLQFFVVASAANGALPTRMLNLPAGAERASPAERREGPLDPSPYLGIVGGELASASGWMPLRCRESAP